MRTHLFPQEIHEQWINFLCDDHASLKACRLICWGLVPLAQRYLFGHVRVQGAPRWLRFLTMLGSSESIGTDVGQYIHKFELIDISIGPRAWPLFKDIVHHASSLRRMPNVQELTLRGWDWVSMVGRAQDYHPESPPRHILFTLMPFQGLKVLELVDNVVRYPQIIPQFLATFPLLSTLRLVGLRVPHNALLANLVTVDADEQAAGPFEIKTLHLQCNFNESFVDAAMTLILETIAKPPFKLSLHTISVDAPEVATNKMVAKQAVLDVLHGARDTLQHLQATIAFAPAIGVGRYSRLQSLSLHWDARPPSTSDGTPLPVDIQHLASQPTLRDVELRFSTTQSHAIIKYPSELLTGLDAVLLPWLIECPAITLRFRFSFLVFVALGGEGITPDVVSLLRSYTGQAVAAGLQATVETVTKVFEPGNVEREIKVEETDLRDG